MGSWVSMGFLKTRRVKHEPEVHGRAWMAKCLVGLGLGLVKLA